MNQRSVEVAATHVVQAPNVPCNSPTRAELPARIGFNFATIDYWNSGMSSGK
jgi:hypothetical protein